MKMKHYFDLIERNEFEKAQIYKNSCIPTTLYKYYLLDDAEDMNDKKLKCLADNKIYLSDFDNFNDPFEGKYLIFDYDKLKEKNWSKEIIDMVFSRFKKELKVSCLTDTSEQNMPMWAYYANNHQGYCVEYELNKIQKNSIFPVYYESEREYANSIITNFIGSIIDSFKTNGLENESKTTEFYETVLINSLMVKHNSWKHEKEYRIVVKGEKYFFAKPKKIYIGKNCKYKRELIEIGKLSEGYTKVYELFFDENQKKFELSKRQII